MPQEYGGPVFDILASRLADFAMTISGSENITFDLTTKFTISLFFSYSKTEKNEGPIQTTI